MAEHLICEISANIYVVHWGLSLMASVQITPEKKLGGGYYWTHLGN